MSPIKKKKLNKIRKQLDKIDNNLLRLFKVRTELVKKVLNLKKYKSQIVDKRRIKAILKRIRKRSLEEKIDPKVTNHIWKNIIKSYIEFEKRNFKKK